MILLSPNLLVFFLFVLFLSCPVASVVPGSDTFAQQGFYFDWNNATLALPTPITAQCESLNIQWGRRAGVGPDPAAPYIIKLYTSTYLNSFIIEAGSGLSTSLPIPFDPGVQYVMCMTDYSGISGGCQDLYTVYPSGNSTCGNVMVPTKVLGVRMASSDSGGLLSRYGWPPSCTDIQFDLVDDFSGGVLGKPPFVLTVAPAFRTPVNITFQESSVKWTVVLDHGHPFFVSITDSEGASWVNGPLHAGAGSLGCLGPTPPYPWLTLPVSLGMSFSFLILGLLIGLISVWYIASRRPIRFSSPNHNDDKTVEPYFTGTGGSAPALASGSGANVNSNAFSNLHFRRPSNNRAHSSEMVLMHDRPGLLRDPTNATLDLAGPSNQEHNQQVSISQDDQHLPRRPSAAEPRNNGSSEDAIEPWARALPDTGSPPGILDERATIEASLAHSATRPPLKRGVGSSSTPSGRSSATARAIVDGRSSVPLSGHIRSSSVGRQGAHILHPRSNSDPRSDSAAVPILSSNYGDQIHQNTASSIPIIRSHSHSSSLPVNVDNGGYTLSNADVTTTGQQQQTHPYQQQQQPTHEVYVVHHDAGLAPPVTVYTRPGTTVTELPPGYDNLIPIPRRETTPLNRENNSSSMSKQSTSTSGSRPQASRAPLEIPSGSNVQDRPAPTGGMTLVNAEDMPLSAISSAPETVLAPGETDLS